MIRQSKLEYEIKLIEWKLGWSINISTPTEIEDYSIEYNRVKYNTVEVIVQIRWLALGHVVPWQISFACRQNGPQSARLRKWPEVGSKIAAITTLKLQMTTEHFPGA